MDTRYSSHPGIKLIRLPRWAAVLAVIAAVSLGLLLLVVAAGLALIIVPVALVGGMILRWRLRRRMAEAARSGDVIDAEYRIIDRER
jgi:regulator of sirC expression with transglutaminase-like and TPR domain